MTTATSLILIAAGAILAFAVSYEVAGISIQTVGVILIVVGGIGLAFALLTIAGHGPWGGSRTAAAQPVAAAAQPVAVAAQPVAAQPVAAAAQPANPAPPTA